MSKKTTVLIFILAGVAVVIAVIAIGLGGGGNSEGMILFYGDGCSHCAIVDEYIKTNNIDQKITFVKKEVRNNAKNAALMAEKAKICKLPADSIGVPFFWDGKTCIVGDQPIIDFFAQKIGA